MNQDPNEMTGTPGGMTGTPGDESRWSDDPAAEETTLTDADAPPTDPPVRLLPQPLSDVPDAGDLQGAGDRQDTTALPGSGDLSDSEDLRRLAGLLARARALARTGGLSPEAPDALRWQGGDLVHALQRAVAQARDRLLDPLTPVDPRALQSYRACAAAYDAFLSGQGLTRGTLVDAGLTAALFPPGDPVRWSLSFSHARTLSRVGSARERSRWAARAIAEGLSVARLQALIVTSGAGDSGAGDSGAGDSGAGGSGTGVVDTGTAAVDTGTAEDLGAAEVSGAQPPGPGSPRAPLSRAPLIGDPPAPPPSRRRPAYARVDALTGRPITDLDAAVELRAHLDAAARAALAPGVRPASAQRWAEPPNARGRFPTLLRFSSLATLLFFLAKRAEILLDRDEIQASERAPSANGPFGAGPAPDEDTRDGG